MIEVKGDHFVFTLDSVKSCFRKMNCNKTMRDNARNKKQQHSLQHFMMAVKGNQFVCVLFRLDTVLSCFKKTETAQLDDA